MKIPELGSFTHICPFNNCVHFTIMAGMAGMAVRPSNAFPFILFFVAIIPLNNNK